MTITMDTIITILPVTIIIDMTITLKNKGGSRKNITKEKGTNSFI